MKWKLFFVLTILAVLTWVFAIGASAATYNNPVSRMRANPDPFVYKHTNGYYYGLSTNEGAKNIVMFRSTSLTRLYTCEYKVVWTAPSSGWNKQDVWAPELHYLNNTFYIYYTAGDGTKQCTGVLRCSSGDPYNGSWSDAGRLYSSPDDWAIDGTVLQQNGNLYFIWSGETPDNMKMQKLFISRMSSPTALTGPRVEISRPTYSWERQGNSFMSDVNEGPEILQRNGKTFCIYSASFCGTQYYKLGMLTISNTADPMVATYWTKSANPVFQMGNGFYGPGHASFTKSPNGSEDWLVYHAMLNSNENQPRYVCMKPFSWNGDGTPNLGAPVASGNMPAGQITPVDYLSSNSVYKIVNRSSGLLIDVAGSSMANSANISQYHDINGNNQKWRAEDLGSGYWKFINVNSGKVIDVENFSTANGANISQYTDTGTTNQQWSLIGIGGGYWKIVNRNSGKLIDVEASQGTDGANISQYQDLNAANQQWAFYLQ